MADIDWCRPEGVAVNNGEANASSLSGRCVVAVNDGITWRRNIELDGVRGVRRDPSLCQDQNVQPVVNDNVVDQRRLVTG